MDILAAIKREERKLEKELGRLQGKLNGFRAAAKALGDKTVREVTQVKKRVMSAAARAKISKATKARWAKFRAQAKESYEELAKVSALAAMSPWDELDGTRSVFFGSTVAPTRATVADKNTVIMHVTQKGVLDEHVASVVEFMERNLPADRLQ